ncbi:uncharacterized protein EKO05_0001565 [Ascochyta rabiei]|uniref:Uncharacterized protein n=1 Tax=Didymella rabiei TaxID=5454 RepID=A0A163FK17_DIDRA|nr:uncharacterized protein EKO05_0001565 [Ascochyta rabiei]KZM24413.1 hypothetical protein ST47_g4446 [Ascochyta rabiei]UPX10933.1 hypothetical protein EKO05_0001565 [Ascochyta rabiei]
MVLAAKQRVSTSQRSPTLSDAGMILPGFEANHARSTSPVFERPPSVSALYVAYQSPKLGFPPQSRRRASQQKQSPPLSTQSSRSTLRDMADSGANAKRMPSRDNLLASSPTIDAIGPKSWPTGSWGELELELELEQRRLSTASSMLSEDFENWPGFDSHENFDDSGVDLQEQDKRGRTPRGLAKDGDGMENDQWMSGRTSGSDEDDMDDPQSSAALSRRAEMILANAKKRLNVMEGNLRGARESLVVSPTLNSVRSASELSQHIASTRERDRKLYAGIGPIPPRTPSYHRNSLLYSNNSSSSPSHTRGASETSIPPPFTPSYVSKMGTGKRASSAMGATRGPWSPEGFGHGRFPIKESRSHEVMRDPRNTWNTGEHQIPGRPTSRSSKSPPALETLREDDNGHTLQRSASATSGLRDQMNDLRGRISSLKQRAQEDHMRRRSLHSLRTPSPFTSSEVWYKGKDGYQAGTSPVTQHAGLGIKTNSPTRKALYEDGGSPTTTFSQQEGEMLVVTRERSPKGLGIQQAGVNPPSTIDEVTELSESTHGCEEAEDNDFVSAHGNHIEPGGDSVYEDAVYEMPVTERHEDRVDAFDYEHFFLHSAMGTYSLENRRSSISSNSSTATTRPVTAMQDSEGLSNAEKRISMHQRNPSVDSVSTVASFATAASHQSDDDDDENERMDQFSQQILSHNQHMAAQRPSLVSLRSDSAIHMRRGTGLSPTQTTLSRGSSRTSSSSGSLASGLQISKMYSILTESQRDEPRLALSEEDKQLIYSLAAGFQSVCANLQNTCGDEDDRKAWRRRLEDARKVLAGEAIEDDSSF